jgi:tRNA(fMet)-specific endonuclease VapC
MSRYLVDTDWIIDVLQGQETAIQSLLHLASQGLAVSLISYGELYEGAYYASHNREVALAGIQSFLAGKELLTLTTRIMERFAIVRGQLPRSLRQQLGDMDLLIAATALTHNLTLVTRNVKDFQHIPGLSLFQVS